MLNNMAVQVIIETHHKYTLTHTPGWIELLPLSSSSAVTEEVS